jgi:hypothetical protein
MEEGSLPTVGVYTIGYVHVTEQRGFMKQRK